MAEVWLATRLLDCLDAIHEHVLVKLEFLILRQDWALVGLSDLFTLILVLAFFKVILEQLLFRLFGELHFN